MKSSLMIALAIGVVISTALLVLEWLTDHSIASLEWQMPGISAAHLFWGAIGGPATMGIAVAWFVNALVYGAGAFAVVTVFRLQTLAPPK